MALILGGCGSVSITRGTGGSGGQNTGGPADGRRPAGALGPAAPAVTAAVRAAVGEQLARVRAAGQAAEAGRRGPAVTLVAPVDWAGRGTAGGPGTGGHAGAGGAAGGRNGHQDAGQKCEDVAGAFQAALRPSKSCAPGSTHQCEQEALTAALGNCPGCQEYLNDNTTLNALRELYNQQGCPQMTPCPALSCIVPRARTCVANDASSGGICTISVATTTN